MSNSAPHPELSLKEAESELKRGQLDNLVINVELTLTSIIQGVALYFLCDHAAAPLVQLRLDQLLYLLNALILIFLFWSRSIGHTLTLIRWPLDYTHNFFYIGAALIESVAFTHVTEPFNWYALLTLFSAVVWVLFIADTRLIERARRRSSFENEQLLAHLDRDQRRNIHWVVPLLFCFHAGAATSIFGFPEFFIKNQFHLVLAILQFAGLTGYLIYLLRFLARVAAMILPTSHSAARSDALS
jgi:hypothetical protein